MGQALFHTSRVAARPEPRRLPLGIGLTVGAGVSAGLWAGLVWAALRLFG